MELGNRAKWIELHIIKIGDDGGIKVAPLATVPEENESPGSKRNATSRGKKDVETERKLLDDHKNQNNEINATNRG
jgi:hypothetical protein